MIKKKKARAGRHKTAPSVQEPLLFQYYPDLRGKIPWIPLGAFPTRVHRLKNLGHRGLWIKREDESSPIYGGNKIRKLEFALGEALARKKKKVVTMGGIGTNHGLATAVFCRRLGLGCRLILFPQPVTRYVKQNMLLFRRYGAELVGAGSILQAGLMFYTTEHLRNPGAYFLYAGGSSPLACMGVVNAVFELKKQVDEGLLPMPDYILCPLGSNGTMAGLSLGVLLAGMPTRVVGVRVSVKAVGPVPVATPGMVRSLMGQVHGLLRAGSRMVPRIEIPPQRVIDDYVGEGYGYPTSEGRAAIKLLNEREGVRLEPTYTAKTFAFLLDFIKDRAHAGATILYWHTYNSVDLSGEAAEVDHRELPDEFHWVFKAPEVQA